MIIAVIPARGGSKGIPHKNIIHIGGKPLLAWSIEQAAASQVDEVVVSTDCESIAAVARHYGATVFERSPETATDQATSESALAEVMRDYQAANVCVFLQATSPMRAAGDIDACIDKLHREGLDSVFTARRIEGWLWTVSGDRIPMALHGRRMPRQLNPVRNYEENGSIYVFRREILERFGSRMGGRIGIHEMHVLDSYQIDEPQDIPFIESLMMERGYVGRESTACV